MPRAVALFLLIVALVPGTWWREYRVPPSQSRAFHAQPIAMPSVAEQARHLGAFRLAGIWRLTSPNYMFGSYSALVAESDGRWLRAFSDRGFLLRMAPPDAPPEPVHMRLIVQDSAGYLRSNDAEAATMDPGTGTVWLGWEGGNRISRHTPGMKSAHVVAPPQMRGWGVNLGPESLVRLRDGRFIVLREGFDGWFDNRHHRALIFAGDPVDDPHGAEFTFIGARGFKPVDMAQLPDGRVLILMRKLVWPMPMRFAGRIAIADPREIRPGGEWRARTVAMLSSSLPIDNFEGMAIMPRGDRQVVVWLISDDNQAVSQRTLLWKLMVDPTRL